MALAVTKDESVLVRASDTGIFFLVIAPSTEAPPNFETRLSETKRPKNIETDEKVT